MTGKLRVNRKPVDDALDADGRKINWLAEQVLGGRDFKDEGVRNSTMYGILAGNVKIAPDEAIQLAGILGLDLSVVVTDVFPYLSYLEDYTERRKEESDDTRKTKMDNKPSQDELIEQMKRFYINRIDALDGMDFGDLLQQIKPTLHTISSFARADMIIEPALDKALYSFDKGTISAQRNGNLKNGTAVDDWIVHLELPRLLDNKEIVSTMGDYQLAWDKAMNRYVGEFINDFCDEDGTVDWEKLVSFNSGKR